jgi:hypothetical protein
MSKFPTFGTIVVGAVEYSWVITRWGGASTAYENLRGVAVSVALSRGRTKELIVEFPFSEFLFGPPESKHSFLERLSNCVEAALSEDWVPTKRGKAFIYVASKKD